jgi:hypothetical protein
MRRRGSQGGGLGRNPDTVEQAGEVAFEAFVGVVPSGDQRGGVPLGEDGFELRELALGGVLADAFVPIETMPAALEQVAAWNPLSALVAAIRELFGNPTTAHDTSAWPMQHPVAAAWIYSMVLAALGASAALRSFDKRTSD